MLKYVKTSVTILSLCWTLAVAGAAQNDQNSPGKKSRKAVSQQGAGSNTLPSIDVPFDPGVLDKNGKVVQPAPELSGPEGKDEGPMLSAAAIADKAKAEAGGFNLSKPLPRSVPLGKSNFLQQVPQGVPGRTTAARNAWKIGESGTHPEKSRNGQLSPDAPFQGNDFLGIGDTGAEPPDVASAAGPFQIVAAANGVVDTFDKNGNLQSAKDLESFFSPLGDPSTWTLYDPVIQYDPYIGRFFFVVGAENDSTHQADLLIAMSRDADVRFGWSLWWIDITKDGNTHNDNFCDYPHLGLDTHAIYMTCNQFTFDRSFSYAKIRIMLKDQFLNNTCCTWFDHWDMREGFLNLFSSQSFQPAMMRLASGDSGEFFVDAEGRGGSGGTLDVWHIPDPVNNPGQLDVSDIDVSDYAPAPSARQPFGAPGINTGDARLLFATEEFGHLSTGQTSNCGGNACAAFYEIDVSRFPTISIVNDWAFQAGGVDYYYPSVDQNFSGDKTMVYSRSSVGEFAGTDYIGIQNSGVCTLCFNGPETLLAAGQNTFSRGRWGDYFSASADPDGLGIWISGEYVLAQDIWATQIGATYNGYAPSPGFALAPVDFGAAGLSSTPIVSQFVINFGNATLLLGVMELTGDPNFTMAFDGCSGLLLQPGGACEVDLQFSPTTLGTHSATFTANWVNTNNTFQLSTAVSGTGIPSGTVTSVSSTPDPSNPGQAVTFTAVVSSQTTGTPTGNVTFKDGNTTLGTASLNGGTAVLTTSSLSSGTHVVAASYGGSSTFMASTGFATQVVSPPATSTVLTASPNPSSFGKTVTFTATVTSTAPGTIAGSVTFMDGTTSLGNATINAGKATLAKSSLTVGTHSITASYNGNAKFSPSTSTAVTENVNKAATTSTLTTAPNPSAFGQAVKLTVTVKSGTVKVGGTVTFLNGAQTLGTATLSAKGVANLSVSSLAAGSNSLTAVYAGNGNFLGSTSAVVHQTVNKAATTTTLKSTPNPAAQGKTVTFTATIKPAVTGTPSGSVTFKDGGTVIGTAPVNASRQAQITNSTLSKGNHNITAAYGGDASYSSSASSAVVQVIN